MTAAVYKTLGEQVSDLRAGLGYSAAGSAAGVNQTILKQFLQQAQVDLYWSAEWVRLRRYETVTIGLTATLIDYPTNANPERITAISVLRSNVWSPPLTRGIAPAMYTIQSLASFPQRWEPYDQIEIWPVTDAAYSLRIFYIKTLGRFTEDGDRSVIDHDLILTVAKGAAKAHYRHPDAPLYLKRSTALFEKLKAKSWSKSVFNRDDYLEENVLQKPIVTP